MSQDRERLDRGDREPIEVLPFDTTEFRESGLLYLANRALHPYGVAIAVTVSEDGTIVDTLSVVETTDPFGFTFPDEIENESRERLFAWLRKRLDR